MKIVIKIGTTSITAPSGASSPVNLQLMEQVVRLIVELRKQGHEPLLVSSGAVGLGSRRLGWDAKPTTIVSKQAAASVGQVLLARMYEELFALHNQPIGQVLLTRYGMQDKERYLNARLTMRELLRLEVVPVINENDVVADDEIRFSDNDYLSAVVSELIGAEHLFILTDTAGLFTADPRADASAVLIPVVEDIDAHVESVASQSGSSWGTGGMLSKVQAARMATSFGTTVHVLSSREPQAILGILNGESHGTTFLPRANSIDNRKAWLACGVTARGKVIIDAGAFRALTQGRSLLPIGIKRVTGKFKRGQAIEICVEGDGQLKVVAKGITKYQSEDLKKIIGRLSEEISHILGYSYGNSAIHRDDMVLLEDSSKILPERRA